MPLCAATRLGPYEILNLLGAGSMGDVYETLTGHRMFEGETISDTLAGVLAKEPEWERVPPIPRSCNKESPLPWMWIAGREVR
jgi:hypothetical protein